MRYGNKLTEGHHADATISADDRTAPVRSPARHQFPGNDDRQRCRVEPGRRGASRRSHALVSNQVSGQSRRNGSKRTKGEEKTITVFVHQPRSSRLRPASATTQQPGRATGRLRRSRMGRRLSSSDSGSRSPPVPAARHDLGQLPRGIVPGGTCVMIFFSTSRTIPPVFSGARPPSDPKSRIERSEGRSLRSRRLTPCDQFGPGDLAFLTPKRLQPALIRKPSIEQTRIAQHPRLQTLSSALRKSIPIHNQMSSPRDIRVFCPCRGS